MTEAGGRARRLFPVGLYASLLVALLALLRPATVEPIERVVRACAALPFRAWGSVAPEEAIAAERSRQRARMFWSQVIAAERRRRPAHVSAELSPLFCAVRARRGADRLELDCATSEVAGCERFVTVGSALVGFVEAGATPAAPPRVALLGARDPARRVPAFVDTGDGALQFVVEPSASIDPWPLRCALIDDPYAAARMQRDGQEALTSGFVDDPLGPLPAGLRIGDLRIWGYDRGGHRLPIGFFVDPAAADERGLTVVTLWRRDAVPALAGARHAGPRVAGRCYELAATRWFAALPFGAPAVPVGRPVVRGERLVGTVSSSGPGYAMITPLGTAGARFDTVLVPGRGEPRRLVVRVRGGTAQDVQLEVDAGEWDGRAGALFTNAAGLPPGLWLGDVSRGEPSGPLWIPRSSPTGGVMIPLREEVKP